jgi:hypothetical protein
LLKNNLKWDGYLFRVNFLHFDSSNPKTYWKIMKMHIKSNNRSNCIPPLRNSINDENFDDIVYGDEDTCDFLNKYFSLILKLEEENHVYFSNYRDIYIDEEIC